MRPTDDDVIIVMLVAGNLANSCMFVMMMITVLSISTKLNQLHTLVMPLVELAERQQFTVSLDKSIRHDTSTI
jgi:hypothetical protein